MIRAFKDIKEFNTEVGKSLGSIIQIRYKANPDYVYIGIITCFEQCTNSITIGGCSHCLEDMPAVYEYFDEKTGKWLPFGVEEPEETEKKKPAKFKVGKKYYCMDDHGERTAFFVTARYKDPLDGKLKVVFDNRVCEVKANKYDEDGEEDNNEFLFEDFLPDVIDARDEVKK